MTDQPVSLEELREIWAMRPVQNGMTHRELAKRYGDRVYHVIGEGWFLKEEEDNERKRREGTSG